MSLSFSELHLASLSFIIEFQWASLSFIELKCLVTHWFVVWFIDSLISIVHSLLMFTALSFILHWFSVDFHRLSWIADLLTCSHFALRAKCSRVATESTWENALELETPKEVEDSQIPLVCKEFWRFIVELALSKTYAHSMFFQVSLNFIELHWAPLSFINVQRISNLIVMTFLVLEIWHPDILNSHRDDMLGTRNIKSWQPTLSSW